MKRMFTLNSKSRSRWMLLLLFLLAGVTDTLAQNVTVSPTSGKLVAALTDENEVGFQNGWSSLWRHEQLPLSFTVSDEAGLTIGGEIAKPAGNINVNDGKLVIMGGEVADLYCVLSLPKGYRITRYKIVLQNNINGTKVSGMNVGSDSYGNRVNNCNLVMYETNYEYNVSGNNFLARGKYSDGSYTMSTKGGETRDYIIERTSLTEGDMSNQIYFRMTHDRTTYFGVTIKSFEVEFTAEGTFNANVAPSAVGPAKSLVASPFKTSKIDVGALQPRKKEGGDRTYYAYSYENVQDLDGNIYIYQSDAIDENGEPKEDVASTKKIYPLEIDGKNAFAFGNGTYYVEPPVSIATSSGQAAPVGYRVVGALFNYLWGTGTSAGSYDVHGLFIQYTSGEKTYYLNNFLHFVETPYEWTRDENNYIKTADGKKYLACYGEHDDRDVQLADVSDYALRLDDDGHIYYTSRSGTNYYLQWYNGSHLAYSSYQQGWDWTYYHNYGNNNYLEDCLYDWSNPTITPKVVKSSNIYDSNDYTRIDLGRGHNPRYVNGYGCYCEDYLCVGEMDNQTINYPAYTPGAYTLTVYDKTGEEVATGTNENGVSMTGTITVNQKSDAGHTFDMGRCNNDAIKFEISGLPEDNSKQALVNVTLLLEALDPYINNMNIVCEDQPSELQMSQTFTANDFRVSGGTFEFYVPKKYEGQEMKLSFAELYSNYGDDSYYGNTESIHRSRYSFVTSDYFTNNKDLYSASYNPESNYENKVIATKAGNIRFKFNNAENLANTSTETATRYLTEYPFTYDGYIGTADPDNKTTDTGNYIDCTATAGDGTQDAGSFFVFTADEPKYNIAPGYTATNEDGEDVTTPHAWQHRSYAFYRMDIKVTAKDFTPVLEWERVYDKACYQKDGKDADDSMWGLTLKTKDGNKEVKGYLTYEDVIDNIRGREASGSGETAIPAIASKLDETNTNAPATMKQILYIDATNLLSMASTKEKVAAEGEEEEKTISHDVNELKNLIGENALIFLPLNNTEKADNVAYLTISNSFNAGRNIVLTDKKPFYSPYNIQVGSANWATYTRDVTVESIGMVKNSTVILPFTLALDGNGVHTNAEGLPGAGKEFTVHTMAASQPTWKGERGDYFATAYFAPYKEETTEANKPYMIKVDENGYADEENKQIFIASQTGSLVLATTNGTELEGDGSTGKYFVGESGVQASSDTENFVLTNKGSYSGMKFDRADADKSFADAEKVFYFSSDKYFDLRTLSPKKQYLYNYPFRAAYAYTSTKIKTNEAKRMMGFFISYDEPQGSTTGIEDVGAEADLMVRVGNGSITLTATRAQAVAIHAISGVNVNRIQLNAGETQVVNLPAGIYVVNNVKVVVK